MDIKQAAKIIIDCLWDFIAPHVNYFANIGENNDNLLNEVERLKHLTADLRREVEREELKGMVPTNVVKGWLRKADEIIKNAEEMQEEVQQNKKCFSRYKLGKRIVEATQVAQDHREWKSRLGGVAVPPLPVAVRELPTTTIREGTSTRDILDRVWAWLMDPNIGIIGIWGTGGVGKTTVAKNIYNQIRKAQCFEDVIFVTVSRDRNMKKLRKDIGKEIRFDYLSTEQDETQASSLLFNKLKEKRFLLILDDLWEKVDLEKLGVPTPKGNDGCKIVITTRKRGVCNDMETDEDIMMRVLSDTEAWDLFQEKAGSVISSDLEPIARDACKECRGLPLAIVVVGRSLRKETDREVWKNALGVLKTSQFELKGMEREVYLHLKFSYDHLKNDSENDILQNCFLYCSLFPEGCRIDVDTLVIDLWTMEGFIEGAQSIERASAKGHSLLKELTDSCLLEKVYGGWVKMHDVIRDMAIKITSESSERGRRFLVRASLGLEDCPKVEEWEGKDRISLMGNNIQSLPDEPKCSGLSTLLLDGNELLQEIPQSFFKQMKNLRVLDLSRTGIVSLPPSISELGSLQALFLRGCRSLESVTHVGGLEQLRLLDLSDSSIEELPREIGQLTRLCRLNLSYTARLVRIPADTIVSLSLLEHLGMFGSSYFSDKSEALIENVGRLNRLTFFSADISNELCTSSQWEFLLRDKLECFRLRIGGRDALTDDPFGTPPAFASRVLDIVKNANVRQEGVGFLQYAEILRLYNHDEVRTISAMGARNLKRLKECRVWECPNMDNIITTEEAEEAILPELEFLSLSDLRNLRSIWEGNGTPGSFGSIKRIILWDCPNLMHLFSSNVLQLLNSLEALHINSCGRMVEIATGEVGNGVFALPRLRFIDLYKLPELNRMWEGVLSLDSLQFIEVSSCPSLRQLAIDIDKTPALEVIEGEKEWLDGLEWQNDSSKSHFQNKFSTI